VKPTADKSSRHGISVMIGEAARFVGGGLLSYALGIAISLLLREIVGLREEISVGIALVVLLVTNFWINRLYIFRASGAVTGQFFRFAATAVVMRGAEYVLFIAFLRGLGFNYLAALTIALLISNCAKFVLYRMLVFRRP